MENKVKIFLEGSKEDGYSIYVDPLDTSLNYTINGKGNSPIEAYDDFRVTYVNLKDYHEMTELPFVEFTPVLQFSLLEDSIPFEEFQKSSYTRDEVAKILKFVQQNLSQTENDLINDIEEAGCDIPGGFYRIVEQECLNKAFIAIEQELKANSK